MAYWALALALAGTWILSEIIFYAFIKYKVLPKLESPPEKQVAWFTRPDEILRYAFQLMTRHSPHYTFHQFVSGFCHMSDIQQIHSTNFEKFLAFSVYQSHIEDLSIAEKEVISSLQTDASVAFDMKWSDEIVPETRHCKFSLEKLDYIHHPLIVHMRFHGAEWMFQITHLISRGYTKKSIGTATYWIKEVPDSPLSPILLFHGICSGWISYSVLIEEIGKNRTVILYDNDSIKHCSMNFHVQTAHELCQNLRELLKQHKIQKITVCGHSWGTFLAGWVVRLAPECIYQLILIDPVCLTIFFPESTYVILYKPSVSFYDYLMEYFVRGDLAITYSVRRQFYWYNSVLRLDEIPEGIRTRFILSDKDELVPFSIASEMIDDFIKERGDMHTKVVWHNKGHAYGPIDMNCVKDIMNI
jgi:pimeloyl-ACP methyl ester carboxylesterase